AAAHSAKRGLELRPAHRSKTRFRRFAIERLLQQTHLHRGVQLKPLGTNFINENNHLPRTTGAKPQIYWAPVRESTRCSAKGAPGDRATGVEFELRCGWPFLRTFTATCRPARQFSRTSRALLPTTWSPPAIWRCGALIRKRRWICSSIAATCCSPATPIGTSPAIISAAPTAITTTGRPSC